MCVSNIALFPRLGCADFTIMRYGRPDGTLVSRRPPPTPDPKANMVAFVPFVVRANARPLSIGNVLPNTVCPIGGVPNQCGIFMLCIPTKETTTIARFKVRFDNSFAARKVRCGALTSRKRVLVLLTPNPIAVLNIFVKKFKLSLFVRKTAYVFQN